MLKEHSKRKFYFKRANGWCEFVMKVFESTLEFWNEFK
jgi:hypothetical protein